MFKSRPFVIEIDFFNEEEPLSFDTFNGNFLKWEEDGVCPLCKCLPCVCGSHAKHKSGYPGENVKRRKDGVPAKKRKKKTSKKGEYRDKSGKLKKTKADYSELWKKVNSNTGE